MPEILYHFRACKAEKEGLVIGHDFANSFKRYRVVADPNYAFIRERLPEMEELGHEASNLEG